MWSSCACNAPRLEDDGQISSVNWHVLHWERALDDRHDHAASRTRIKVAMGNVGWHEHGLAGLDRGVIVADENQALALPAEDHLVCHWMPMLTVLLTRFEAVDVAVEMGDCHTRRRTNPCGENSWIASRLFFSIPHSLLGMSVRSGYRHVTSSQYRCTNVS